jgi:hypothetical protein
LAAGGRGHQSGVLALLLTLALLLVVVAAAAREVTPGAVQQMPTLVNMSDDPFRITDGTGQVVAVVPPSPYTVDMAVTFAGPQVIVRRRGHQDAVAVDEIPVVPGVSYLVPPRVASVAGRPDFLTDTDLFTV